MQRQARRKPKPVVYGAAWGRCVAQARRSQQSNVLSFDSFNLAS